MHKTDIYKIERMTKEMPVLGNYLVGIRLELLISEEYDLVCCGIVSSSNSKSFEEGILSWKSI